MFNSTSNPKATPKAEETGLKILHAALDLFRHEGFDSATMRGIAQKAEVATGAAYYYYPSKEAIVLDFTSARAPRCSRALRRLCTMRGGWKADCAS